MMLPLIFTLMTQTPSASSFEVMEGSRPDMIQVEALVKLPALGPHELAEMTLVVDTLLEDTEDYGKQELLERTSIAGDTISAELLPDAVRIHFAVSASEPGTIVSILDSLLHGSRLTDEAIAASKADEAFRERPAWDSSLSPSRPKFDTIRPDDVREAYRRFFTANQMYFVIAAPKELLGQDFSEQWATKVALWEPTNLRQRLVDKGHVPVVTERAGKLTTVALRSSLINTDNPYPAILASFALGGGKGATVFQDLREKLGWSYRQEAPLRGVSDGFEQVIALVSQTSEADFDHAQAIKPLLLASVDKWTSADRLRALGAAKAVLLRGVGIDPLYFLGTRPATDPCFLHAYWRMKMGTLYDPGAILARLDSVDLEAMTTAAKAEIEGAGIELIRGKD